MGIVSFKGMKMGGTGGENTRNYEQFCETSKAPCKPSQAPSSLWWCRGREEDWIKIQANTFKNWINVNLRETGLTLEDLSTDFSDGVRCVIPQFFSV
jgi:hypothetical protein